MKKLLFGKALLIKPKSILILFFGISLFTVVLVTSEIVLGKKEINNLLAEQSYSYLETIIHSSQVSLLSNEEIENVIIERLINDAQLIDLLYQRKQVSNELLFSIAEKNGLNRINIFNKGGKKIYNSHPDSHDNIKEDFAPEGHLNPIFNDEADTLVLGLKAARFEEGYRYAVAIAAYNNDAIVINISADEILNFRQMLGFGQFLKIAGSNNLIKYIALQDENGIIAGTGELKELELIENSPFLSDALNKDDYIWRITDDRNVNVFEAVHPFFYKGELVGLFRLGLSLDPLDSFNARTSQRLIFVSIFLIVMGTLVGGFVLIRGNYEFVKKQLGAAELFSERILQNVSDAILVINDEKKITVANDATLKLLDVNYENIHGKEIVSFINSEKCKSFLDSNNQMESINCVINGQTRYLLISKSIFRNEHEKRNTVLVIKDLSEIKQLEEQANRNERLLAMGELASGVAHEIRNPLNTIGTIVQQLEKDFYPVENAEEYSSLTKLVREEVKRINSTIQSFLLFAKPEPVVPDKFALSDLLGQLKLQYNALTAERNIELIIPHADKTIVTWDRNKMLQVFINLIQNSIDAIEKKGKITFEFLLNENSWITFRISDSGKGIPNTDLDKIFNLYFTTKANGTGIGLSIIQRIIYEHDGIISVESEPEIGTTFIIKLPQHVNKKRI